MLTVLGVILLYFTVTKITLSTASTPCNSSYRYPDYCSLQSCDYQVRWSVAKDTGDVYFNIIDRIESDNYWTGIGFNTKGAMENAEVVMGGFMPNNTFLYRTIIYGPDYKAMQVKTNNETDLAEVSGSKTTDDNKTFIMFRFKRKLRINDAYHQQVGFDKCLKFLYPVWSNVIDADGRMRKHAQTPLISKDDVCLSTCIDTLYLADSVVPTPSAVTMSGPAASPGPSMMMPPGTPPMPGATGMPQGSMAPGIPMVGMTVPASMLPMTGAASGAPLGVSVNAAGGSPMPAPTASGMMSGAPAGSTPASMSGSMAMSMVPAVGSMAPMMTASPAMMSNAPASAMMSIAPGAGSVAPSMAGSPAMVSNNPASMMMSMSPAGSMAPAMTGSPAMMSNAPASGMSMAPAGSMAPAMTASPAMMSNAPVSAISMAPAMSGSPAGMMPSGAPVSGAMSLAPGGSMALAMTGTPAMMSNAPASAMMSMAPAMTGSPMMASNAPVSAMMSMAPAMTGSPMMASNAPASAMMSMAPTAGSAAPAVTGSLPAMVNSMMTAPAASSSMVLPASMAMGGSTALPASAASAAGSMMSTPAGGVSMAVGGSTAGGTMVGSAATAAGGAGTAPPAVSMSAQSQVTPAAQSAGAMVSGMTAMPNSAMTMGSNPSNSTPPGSNAADFRIEHMVVCFSSVVACTAMHSP